MEHTVICIPVPSPALRRAGTVLSDSGCRVVFHPGPEVTHLLLPVPSLDPDGNIRGGGSLETLLAQLAPDITVIGGMLTHPALEHYKILDLLKDEDYLWHNAAITAHCALKYIWEALPVCLPGREVLILGWGRIGKCLAGLLRNLGASVVVSARKPEDRAMIGALGFRAVNCTAPEFDLQPYSAIINTVPVLVLDGSRCAKDCFLLDLASKRGIAGDRVMWARSLPGKDAPVSSGELIAQTVHRLIQGKEHHP